MWNAVIAGAGPAGAAAACVLARAGRRVLLADADEEGFRVGEALHGAARPLLREIGAELPAAGGPHALIGGNLSGWGSDALVAHDFMADPAGASWRLDRTRFDADLRVAAVRAGAQHGTSRVADVGCDGDVWRVRLENGTTATAHWLVDATGRRAAIARRQGARRLRDARLVAVYALGDGGGLQLDRTLIEAAADGWWYAARLPSGRLVGGFHTAPATAVRMMAEPDRWRNALADTRHLAGLFGSATFERPLMSFDACGARLDAVYGDGWIACGDAALSFDPVAGQGILQALHSGVGAARAVHAALDGDPAAELARYRTRLDQIRRVYVDRRRAAYRDEARWPDAPFWAAMQRDREVLHDPAAVPGRHDAQAKAGQVGVVLNNEFASRSNAGERAQSERFPSPAPAFSAR